MPDTYLDSSVVGFDHQDALNAQIDTYKRLAPILDVQDHPAIGPEFADNLNRIQVGPSQKFQDLQQIDMESALTSNDPNIKQYGLAALKQQTENSSLENKFNLGATIDTPTSALTDKFQNKEFKFSALRDNEDFYYNNVYMKDGWLKRNLIMNPARFIARVVPTAGMKAFEGLGYIGSLLTSVGSTNYWASVADNGFSNWFMNLEQDYKDQIIPVYKQAGFDNKGFFSKLTDWSFWNDSVADGVAFMASAAIPGLSLSGIVGDAAELGAAGARFGRAFGAGAKLGSIGQRLGTLAGKAGLGSWAELSSWTFNTGMEAAQEGAGVYKTLIQKMKDGRRNGDPEYANMTDDEMQKRAGSLAANDIAVNFAILGFSNAWENKLFFKGAKHTSEMGDIALGKDFSATSKDLTQLDKAGFKAGLDVTNPLRRLPYYGKIAVEGTVMEGLWEENAQNAISRIDQGDAEYTGTDGRKHTRGFWDQLLYQTGQAFSGKDEENAESIGLGALIGIMGGAGFSKFAGERREMIENTRKAVENIEHAKQTLFATNDIYQRDADNKIVFEDHQPKVDPIKLQAKKDTLQKQFEKLAFANKDEYFTSKPVQFVTQRALADYVRSMNNIGNFDIASRLRNINPENATLFGMDPGNVNTEAWKFSELASNYERLGKEVDRVEMGVKPSEMSPADWNDSNENRKAKLYRLRTDNHIIGGFTSELNENLLKSLNTVRTLNNSSLSDFPVDQVNTLIQQKLKNDQFMKSDEYKNNSSPVIQKYHENRSQQLQGEIDAITTQNEISFEGLKKTEKGFFVPARKNLDGSLIEEPFDSNATSMSFQTAGYNNIVHKNSFIDNLISHPKDGHKNFVELGDTASNKELVAKINKALENPVDKIIPNKFKELVPGDFDKVLGVVRKLVYSDHAELTDEDRQLQANYGPLVDFLLPKFESVTEDARVKLLNQRLANYQKNVEVWSKWVAEKTIAVEEKKATLQQIQDELQKGVSKADQTKIQNSIDELVKNISIVQDAIDEKNARLADMQQDMDSLSQEIQQGNYRGLQQAASNLQNEINDIKTDIDRNNTLLDYIKQVLADMLAAFKSLFPRLRKIDVSRALSSADLTKADPALQADLATQSQKHLAIESLIKELGEAQAKLEANLKLQNDIINTINEDTDKFFRDQYLDRTKAKPQPEDPQDRAIREGLVKDKALFEGGNNGGSQGPDENAGFDGNTYQRPLATKFATTTFPDLSIESYDSQPQEVKDYFDFTTFVTENPAAKAKLGKKGKLKSLVVTRNNVDSLGLRQVIDKDQYFAKEAAKDTHFEVVPVVEENGTLYYVDKELNRVGKVSDNKPPKNIIRTSLRLPRFTEAETTQYLQKYSQKDMDKAIKVAIDWRTSYLGISAKTPMKTVESSITRGIQNKLEMQDQGRAENPVIGTLLREGEKISPQAVRVYTENNGAEINGDSIQVPAGRPFIYTKNGDHEQLHPANNTLLSEQKVKDVTAVLFYMLVGHNNSVEKKIAANPKLLSKAESDKIASVGGIKNLDAATKKAIYLKLTKEPGALFDSNSTNYLSSILYFTGKTEGKAIGDNQIYFKGPNLVLGKSGITVDLTDPASVHRSEVHDFLKKQFHNIKYFPDVAKASRAYREYYMGEDGNSNSREWANYATYLLSDKYPDGTKRDPVITTSVMTKEQHDTANTGRPYSQYVSRGINLKVGANTTVTKQQEVTEEKGTYTERPLRGADKLIKSKKKEENIEEDAEPVQKGGIMDRLNKISKDNDVPEPKKKGGFMDRLQKLTDELPADEAFRVSTSGVFRTEEDLNVVMADVKRMLPQVNQQRLSTILKTADGREAWGQFVNNTIKVYEGAEEGTAYHEAFEAVVNTMLSDHEWNAMKKEFLSRGNQTFEDRESGETIQYKDANDHQIKEQLAEEFRDFKLGNYTPVQPQTKSYFKIIWDFIKSLFGGRVTIDSIFNAINDEKFADRTVSPQQRFANNFRILPEIPIEVKRDLYEGATSFMFRQVFNSPKSLSSLDEIFETDASLYEPIKAQFTKTVEVLNNRLKGTNGSILEKDEKVRKAYEQSIKYTNIALSKWKDFVQGHQQELKPYRIKFEEQEKRTGEDDVTNQENRNDYNQDIFKTDGKRSASKSVRFLFGTLVNLEFDKSGETRMINDRLTGKTSAVTNSTFMNSIVRYDDFMLKALDEFKDLNDFSRIEAKMAELSGINEIEAYDEHTRPEYIANLSAEKAIWTGLYNRVFGFNEKVDEEAAWNLKVKLHNYVSKHAPEPFVYINGGGTSTIINAHQRPFFESVTRTIESSLINKADKVFKRKTVEGVKSFVPNAEFEKAIDLPKFRETFKTKEGQETTRVKQFINYLGLNDYITKEFYDNLSQDDQKKLDNILRTIRNAFAKVKTPSLNVKQLDIAGYVSRLIVFLDAKLNPESRTSQHLDINNELRQNHVIPSFVSRIVAEINAVQTLDELHERFPQTATIFAEDSIILQRLFDEEGNRTSEQFSMGYMDGIKDNDEQEGTKTSRLEFHDKYYLQFQASLRGLYYSLPADSETEWLFNMGEFVPFSEKLMEEKGDDIINSIFLPKLLSEIRQAQVPSKLLQLQGKHLSATENTIGTSLRFFKDILASDKGLINDIHKGILAGTTAEKIVMSKKNLPKVMAAIRNYIDTETAAATKILVDSRIVSQTLTDYVMRGIDSVFLEKYAGTFKLDEGAIHMSADQFKALIEYQKINSIVANMEQFKVVFGDPAQYKDWEKRAKSLFGPVEQTFYERDGRFNNWLNLNKNQAVLGDEKVDLSANDWFRTEFSDNVNSRTVEDFDNVVNVDTYNDLASKDSDFVKKFLNEYKGTNETDGQSIGTLGFARHLMIKSGWRWTAEHEAYFQYDTALMRQELNYDYKDNKALEDLDKKIIEHYKDNPPMASISPVKTLMPFVNKKGEQNLLKHSVHFVSYQIAKEYELLDTYRDMLRRNDQILNFRSVQKIGLEVDNQGEVTKLYNNPFEKNDLETLGNPQQSIDLRTIGVQVETQGTGQGQTLGSQVTKLSNLNMAEDSIPTDFDSEGLSPSQALEKWVNLSEDEKIAASKKYALVKGPNGTISSLSNMKMKNALDTFNKLGINWKYKNGQVSYDINNVSKIRDYIKDELQRLEVDSNTIDNIQLSEDMKSFVNAAEALPSYTTISNLLWAMADKAVSKMKVNGKSLIQVSSVFFNKNSRQATYFEDGKWIKVDNKADYDRLAAEGKDLKLTSSELAFYTINKETGETNPMEVLLPQIYLDKVNKTRIARGMSKISEKALIDHLNSNPKLLEGIGFRIPTQALSSMDFFKIKGFLHPAFGSAIVVPSGITTKAGSDFDVDKLNTYLNNYKLDKNGLPFYEEYKDDSNSTVEERYANVYGRKRQLLKRVEQYLLKNYDKEILNSNTEASVEALMAKIFPGTDDISYYSDPEIQEVLSESINFSKLSYKELLEKVKDEEATNPTLEEFKELPLHLQNNRGALENKYFESIRNVLKQPDMFEMLLSPNSIEHVRNNRNYVQEALDEGWKPEDKKEINYSKFLSTEYIAKKRNDFTKGKTDIGIFAVAMTNFANSQVTGISITSLGEKGTSNIKSRDSAVFDELNQGHMELPFEDIEMKHVNGSWMIPISKMRDKTGALTMDKLSAYINGAVDVAKDPIIIEMGMHTELAGVYTLMERMGLTGKTTALFLYQPAIREYLKELLLLDSKSYFGASGYRWTSEVIEGITDEYRPAKFVYDPKYKISDKQLFDAIRKGEQVKQGKAKWTEAEKELQYYSLVNYLKLKMYSNNLLESIQASNHDTASIRNPYIVTKKDLILENAKSANVINKAGRNGSIVNGGQALRDETSVGTDVTMLKHFNSMLSRIGLFALQRPNPKSVLENVARRIFKDADGFVSDDDFIKVMRDYESTMIDSLVNRVQIPGEEGKVFNPLWKFGGKLLRTESKSSLKKQFESIKKTYPTVVKSNFFLSNLEITSNQSLGIDVMELKKKPSNSDVLTKEQITEGLLQLASYNNKNLVGFYKGIILGSYLQYGIKFSRKSFVDLLPISTINDITTPWSLTDLTKPALKDIDSKAFTGFDEHVQRSKWFNKAIITPRMERSLHFLNMGEDGKYTLAKYAKSHNSSNFIDKPRLTSQTFFAKWDPTVENEEGNKGDVVPDIQPVMLYAGKYGTHSAWADMPNIIGIQAIKPEFLDSYFDDYLGRRVITVAKGVKNMMKRGDHSYKFVQLFKKVGAEDSALGRGMIVNKASKKNPDAPASVSYLYKPIYKQGDRDFAENKPLLVTSANTIVGQKSILNSPEFIEMEDSAFVNNINNITGKIRPVIEPKATMEGFNTFYKPISEGDVKDKEDDNLPPAEHQC